MQELLNKIASVVEERNTYKEAWRILVICFGEQMQDDELELMDNVLSSVKLDFEESRNAIQAQTPSQI